MLTYSTLDAEGNVVKYRMYGTKATYVPDPDRPEHSGTVYGWKAVDEDGKEIARSEHWHASTRNVMADAKRFMEEHGLPRIDESEVTESDQYGDKIESWHYVDAEGDFYRQTVRIDDGTYKRADGREVPVYRWESREDGSGYVRDRGDWTFDREEAYTDGEEYAQRKDQHYAEKNDEILAEREAEDEDENEDDSGDYDTGYTDSSVRNDAVDLLGDFEEDAKKLKLIGAPAGAKVAGKTGIHKHQLNDEGFEGYGFQIKVDHPDLEYCQRFVGVDANGDKFIHNEVLFVKRDRERSGIGSRIFADQVADAIANGFSYIVTHAAGHRGHRMNGYYTWPRFGYDMSVARIGDSNPRLARGIKENFPDARSILDVMETKEGRDWWKENGTDLYEAKFDLSPGSRSRKILRAYLEEKGTLGDRNI